MEELTDITKNFDRLYYPQSALVFYKSKDMQGETYVEHFDMDSKGCPINAHPLTVREANVLAKALWTEKEKDTAFLKPKGILPTNILHISSPNREKAAVLWQTKAQIRQLYFTEGLGIPNGRAFVPPMLWHASQKSLTVFALASGRRATEKTPLYHTPFFNTYENGNVCMGTVSIEIKNSASLEEFTRAWEGYFFNSYFSHLMGNHNPVKGNCVNLWKRLVTTGKPFPKEVLRKTGKTLKDLLV